MPYPEATSTRLHVVFLDHVAVMSGGEIALLRLIRALDGRVRMSAVLAEDGQLRTALAALDVPVHVVPLPLSVRDFRKGRVALRWPAVTALARTIAHIVRLRSLLRALDADVVHTNSLKSGIYGGLAARLARVPHVWHLRDRIAPDYLPWTARLLVLAALRSLPRAVVCNSRATADTVGWSPHPVLVVPDPYDPPAGPVADRSSDRVLTFSVVGRLTPWKGQDVAIRAFASMASDEQTLQIIGAPLFGEDEYADELRALVKNLDLSERVTFFGHVADVERWLQVTDVLVHCSTVPEPFGQVIIEGMAAGAAVIATSGGGPSEIIDDGVDGLLVPARDTAALAAAMTLLADDPSMRRRLGSSARSRAATFIGAAVAPRFLSLYEEVAARR